MAEEIPNPVVTTATLVSIMERKYGSDNKSLWNLVFRQDQQERKVTTFSSTFAGALANKVGQDLKVEVSPSVKDGVWREFSGEKQWDLSRLWVDGKEVEHTTGSGGGGRGRGGGGGYKANPEWSFRTPEERQRERSSIEAQKSLDKAGAIVHAAVQLATDAIGAGAFKSQEEGFDLEAALTWVEQATERLAAAAAKAVPVYAGAIRAEVDGAGSGSQARSPRAAQGPGRSSGSGAPASQAGAGGASGATDAAPAVDAGVRRSPPEQSTRSGPAPSASSGFSPERWEALVEAWGGQKKDLGAVYRTTFSKEPTISAITEEELAYLEGLAQQLSGQEMVAYVKESQEQLAKQEGAVA